VGQDVSLDFMPHCREVFENEITGTQGGLEMRIPGNLIKVELVVFEDSGHFPFIEAPEVFFKEVRIFLEETGNR